MKRPRIALCLLMAIFATSLYAVGFAADRENAAGGYDTTDWAAHESELCEYAHEGYCEYAYDRPQAAYLYDGCTAGEDESLDTPDDDNCQVAPTDIDELEAAGIDAIEAGYRDSEEIGLAAGETLASPDLAYEYDYEYDYYRADQPVEVTAPDLAYENEYENEYDNYYAGQPVDVTAPDLVYENEYENEHDDYYAGQPVEATAPDLAYENEYENEYDNYYAEQAVEVAAPAPAYEINYGDDYAEELAERPEPQEVDAGNWCGRYCLSQECEPLAAETLPNGTIRNLVERVSESLVRLLHNSSESLAIEAAAADDASQIVLPLVSVPGWADGLDWSAANNALAAGMNRTVVADPLLLAADSLKLPARELQPVSLRALAKPLARLVVGMRDQWQQAWSELSELAAEGDDVPEVSSRPDAPVAEPSSDPGRDTRTSLRRSPRRVEI